MSAVTPQRLQELLMFINASSRMKRSKGLEELSKITVYPDLVPNVDEYITNILVAVLKHVDDESDSIREKCVNCLTILIKQLGTKSLDNVLESVLPTLFKRIEEETTEEVLKLILALLLYFVDLVSVDTYPSTWDAFVPPTIVALTAAGKSEASDVKLLTCQILLSMCKKIKKSIYKDLSEPLIKVLMVNMKHRHQEVRKTTLNALAQFYVVTASEAQSDNIATLLEKMVDDRVLAVRLAVVDYIKTLLVEHEIRHMYYPTYIPTLLSALYGLVPMRKIAEEEELKQPKPTKLATAAWEALDAIGKQHELDKEADYRDELQYTDCRNFDSERELCHGLKHIIQDNFVRMMDHIIPMLIEWTEQIRTFGLRAMGSLIHLAGEYSTRYVIQVMGQLANSIRNIRGDQDMAMRVAAILACNIPGDDLIAFLVPQFTNEGPKEVVMLLQVSLVNAKFTDGGLGTIMSGINECRVFDALDCINNLAEAVLAMIMQSEDFREVNSFTILTTILRICEKGDAMHYFENCFGRPLATVFSEQMMSLLTVTNKSAGFLSQLLLKVPPYAIQMNIVNVCQAMCESVAQSEQEGTKQIMDLITTLCHREAIPDITENLLDLILSKMEWIIGKENVPPREAATFALAALMKCGALTPERVDENFEKLLTAVLNALDDSWSDPVRVAAVALAREFIAKCGVLHTKFDDIYKAFKERLDDHILSVRVTGVYIMAEFLMKCQSVESVPSKWDELLLFIDDEVKDVRDAMAEFCIKLAGVKQWKDGLIASLEKIIANNYHEEATVLGKATLEKMRAL